MQIINLGEGIAFAGIMIAVGLTENYWLLFLLIWIFSTWAKFRYEEDNEQKDEQHRLEMLKLKEEIRLLEVRKR